MRKNLDGTDPCFLRGFVEGMPRHPISRDAKKMEAVARLLRKRTAA
jgi:hypothetical protein